MNENRPDIWTDDEVREYLTRQAAPLEGWWFSDTGGYGFCGRDGLLFACADDDGPRALRIEHFLRSIGARTFEEIISLTPGSTS